MLIKSQLKPVRRDISKDTYNENIPFYRYSNTHFMEFTIKIIDFDKNFFFQKIRLHSKNLPFFLKKTESVTNFKFSLKNFSKSNRIEQSKMTRKNQFF